MNITDIYVDHSEGLFFATPQAAVQSIKSRLDNVRRNVILCETNSGKFFDLDTPEGLAELSELLEENGSIHLETSMYMMTFRIQKEILRG